MIGYLWLFISEAFTLLTTDLFTFSDVFFIYVFSFLTAKFRCVKNNRGLSCIATGVSHSAATILKLA